MGGCGFLWSQFDDSEANLEEDGNWRSVRYLYDQAPSDGNGGGGGGDGGGGGHGDGGGDGSGDELEGSQLGWQKGKKAKKQK